MKCYMVAPSNQSVYEFDQSFIEREPIKKTFARTYDQSHRAYNVAISDIENAPLSSVRDIRHISLERAP